jgi:hypothetical protein
MSIADDQLAVILQASLEHAKERLERDGSFLPFATRALRDGELEFLHSEGEHLPPDVLCGELARMLADEARRGAILATGLTANGTLRGKDGELAVSVLVEAPEFCRRIVVPYRLWDDEVQFGNMVPEDADSLVFAAQRG